MKSNNDNYRWFSKIFIYVILSITGHFEKCNLQMSNMCIFHHFDILRYIISSLSNWKMFPFIFLISLMFSCIGYSLAIVYFCPMCNEKEAKFMIFNNFHDQSLNIYWIIESFHWKKDLTALQNWKYFQFHAISRLMLYQC